MPLTKTDCAWLENILKMAIDDPCSLSDWENNFCDDLNKRYLREGNKLALSEKQLERLTQIEEKLEAA